MIKSRKLFARALYLVFALALVAGVSLVPAMVSAAPTDVWVDDGYSGVDDDGGHDWGVDAFATIQGGALMP